MSAATKVLVVTYQRAEGELRKMPEIPGVEWAHFNAIRGKDRWKGVDAVVVAGRLQPNVEDLEATAEALFWQDPSPIERIEADAEGRKRYPTELRGYRMHDGSRAAVAVEYHPDPRCNRLLYQIRESEIVQAIDRARLIHRDADKPCRVTVLTNVVLPITVDALTTWREAVPDKFQLATLRGPAVPASYRELSRVFPDLWPSAEAARKYAGRTKTPDVSLLIFFIGKCPGFRGCEYRLAGKRGPWTPAAVHADAEDPKAALESVVGPVAGFRLIDLPAELRQESEQAKVVWMDIPFETPAGNEPPAEPSPPRLVETAPPQEDAPAVIEQDVPSFDQVFDAYGLDPLLDDDRLEAVRIWMGLCAMRSSVVETEKRTP